jgi:hypothetical protein
MLTGEGGRDLCQVFGGQRTDRGSSRLAGAKPTKAALWTAPSRGGCCGSRSHAGVPHPLSRPGRHSATSVRGGVEWWLHRASHADWRGWPGCLSSFLTSRGGGRTQMSSIVAGLTGGWGRCGWTLAAQLDKSGGRNPKAIGPLSSFSGFLGRPLSGSKKLDSAGGALTPPTGRPPPGRTRPFQRSWEVAARF